MGRPSIREILRRFDDGELERDDACRRKMSHYGTCVRGVRGCAAHHREAWVDWSTEGELSWGARDGWTVSVTDSDSETKWSVVGPRGERAKGEANTRSEGQLAAEQAMLKLRFG